jgi:radical SAM protein (TIGR01212 family)
MSSGEFIWGHRRRFNSYTEYIRRTFGGRIQKVVVDAGFTCPNRDGSRGTGGCTYCDNDAFNPSYCRPETSIHEQIAQGIEFHAVRYRKAEKFLVYFQPYSNTYAPLDVLRELYGEALRYPGVAGLVIGTRPDCVDDEKLKYLKELSEQTYIQVEYGVESCYGKTLSRINRGHDFGLAEEVISRTHASGIRTGIHLIFGLPGETKEEMTESVEILSRLPVDSVKFHQLQIVNGTKMAMEYRSNPGDFHLFGLEEYISFIVSFIERLNPSIVIERFSGEVPPRLLYLGDEGVPASPPSWGLIRYDAVLRLVERELEERKTWQGRLFGQGDCPEVN